MRPVVFEQCFGWLHDATGNMNDAHDAAVTGVILCNPYGHEALWTHRSWRKLADHLSSRGMPTLRFDYRGTGDSLGNEEDGAEVERWLDSLRDAVRFLKASTGIQRVALCGVRLGAALAALVAETCEDVDALVLMTPVTSGREYLRELKLIQRRWRNSSVPHLEADATDPSYVETLGFRLHAPSVEQLSAIALPKQLSRAVPHVLIFDPAPSRESSKLLAFYRGAGSHADTTNFDEYALLISDRAELSLPNRTFERVGDWLREHLDIPAALIARPEPSAAALRHPTALAGTASVLRGDGFIETPIVFDNGRLFGMYCCPDRSSSVPSGHSPVDVADAVDASGHDAVLFSNTASSHHIGEARMWVTHARHLARNGVASLRMDIGVLGDSAGALGMTPEKAMHSRQACLDVSAGVNWLVAAGYVRPTVMGICSGAYLSLHAAVINPNVAGAVLINQRAYVWADNPDAPTGLVIAPTRVYLLAARNPEKWRRLLRGEVAVSSIVGALTRRHLTTWYRKSAYLVHALLRVDSSKAVIRKAFQTFQHRGVDVRIIYGEFDAGLDECETFFGRNLKWLRRCPTVRVLTERSLDHALFLYPARELIIREVDEHLRQKALTATTAEMASALTPPSGATSLSANTIGLLPQS